MHVGDVGLMLDCVGGGVGAWSVWTLSIDQDAGLATIGCTIIVDSLTSHGVFGRSDGVLDRSDEGSGPVVAMASSVEIVAERREGDRANETPSAGSRRGEDRRADTAVPLRWAAIASSCAA